MFIVLHFTQPGFRCTYLSSNQVGYNSTPLEIALYSFLLYSANVSFVGLCAFVTFKLKKIGGATLVAEKAVEDEVLPLLENSTMPLPLDEPDASPDAVTSGLEVLFTGDLSRERSMTIDPVDFF